MNNDNSKILVGKIVAFHGVRGDVRIQTYTANPQDFQTLQILSDKFGSDDFRFIRTVPNSDVIIAHIRGFEDRTSAEVLRGTQLFVNRDTLPPAKDGEYYQSDLIGFEIVRDEKSVGKICGFQNFGAGDIIENENGDMFSFRGANVDFENRTVKIV